MRGGVSHQPQSGTAITVASQVLSLAPAGLALPRLPCTGCSSLEPCKSPWLTPAGLALPRLHLDQEVVGKAGNDADANAKVVGGSLGGAGPAAVASFEQSQCVC